MNRAKTWNEQAPRHAASALATVIAPIGQEAHASLTASSSVRAVRTTARPSSPSSNTSGAIASHTP